MVLEIGRALSFFMSILSLCALMTSAFFVPGSRWQDRLTDSLLWIALSACLCFASGMLFQQPQQANSETNEPLTHTLPVRLFFWALAGMAILFFLSWYLEEYYVPLLWRNQPH